MKRFSMLVSGGLSGVLLALSSSMVHAETGRLFSTETASIADKGSISVDFEYATGTSAVGTGVRIGALDGEVLLNNNNSGFAQSSIGYKTELQKNMAAYGILSYLDDGVAAPVTDFAIGISYTIKEDPFLIHINGELITDEGKVKVGERGGNSTLFVKGALEFSIDDMLKRSSLIAEVMLENNDAITGPLIALGLRWQPSRRVTADFILYADDGTTQEIGIPGSIKLNLAF